MYLRYNTDTDTLLYTTLKKIGFASKWHQLDTNLRQGKRSERIEHVAIKFKIHKNMITTHTTLCHSLPWWAMYRIFSSVEYLEVPLHYLGSAMYLRYVTDTENGSIFEYLRCCISDTPQPCTTFNLGSFSCRIASHFNAYRWQTTFQVPEHGGSWRRRYVLFR